MKTQAKTRNIIVRPKNPNMRWVAIDNNYKIISEGRTPQSAANKATKKGLNFYLLFVPKPGRSYVL
jgi:hypothetical protein